MKNKDRYNLSELTVSTDNLFGVPILRVYQGRDLKTRKEIATIRRYGGKRVNYFLDWLEEDCPILDDKEKEYLSAVIKPWRNKVKCIEKMWACRDGNKVERILIEINGELNLILPFFMEGTMYKGMELNKEYSLEDLGI